jgi:hypothetical protein
LLLQLFGFLRGRQSFSNICYRPFFEVGRRLIDPTTGLLRAVSFIGIAHPPKTPSTMRKLFVSAFVVDARDRDLAEMIFALRAAAGFACCLDGREQQRDEDADDGDDD